MIEGFSDDVSQIYDVIKTTNQCEYLVEDVSNPDKSFRNAEIKCSLIGNTFKALIVGATDVQHGLAVDDGCHFVNAKGLTYDAFDKGEYVLKATLKDSKGNILSISEKRL